MKRRVPVGAPTQLLTSRNVAPLCAIAGDGGGTSEGIVLGTATRGATYRFDPFDAYAEGLVTNPNVLVAGQVGRGKSALLKLLVLRSASAGRRCVVVDPKGEYAPLAEALGTVPVALAPGGAVCVNPLDGERGDPARVALLGALVAAGLERPVSPSERAALEVALLAADDAPGTTTLRSVLDHLLVPQRRAAASLGTTVEALASEGRVPALELRRLVTGELRGMFDGETTPGVGLDGDVVVLDVSGALESGALPVVLSCAAAAFDAARRASRGARSLVVLDEAWSLLAHESAARWLQASFKLARARGVAHVLVLHRLSDVRGAGADGSVTANLAAGLLRDIETAVLFAQTHAEAEALSELLALTDAERELVERLPRAFALWRVGRCRSVVHHQVAPHERPLIDTDARMRG